MEEEVAEEVKEVENIEVEEEKKEEKTEAEEISVEPGYARCLRCNNVWKLRSLTPGKKKCPICGSQRVLANISKPSQEAKKVKTEKKEEKKEKKEEKEEKKKDFKGWLWAMLGFVAVSAFLAVYFLKSNRGQDRRKDDEGADKGGYRFNYPGIPGLR